MRVSRRIRWPNLWDAANLRFPNAPEADKLLTKTYRKGFEVAAA
jgi:hypothetical protein